MHNVLSCRGLPEQRFEVRMNGKSESSKNLGKSFQVDRRSSKWPQGGKTQLYEDWMESKQKQRGKTKWEDGKRQGQKDRVHITQNLKDHGQGACILLFFIGENHWRASGREVTEFDLKNKKSLAF